MNYKSGICDECHTKEAVHFQNLDSGYVQLHNPSLDMHTLIQYHSRIQITFLQVSRFILL